MIERAMAKGQTIDGGEVLFTQVPPGTGGEKSEGAFGLTFEWVKKRLIKSDKHLSAECLMIPYAPNGINWVSPQGSDVISSKFTGCYMAKYTVGGSTRVAHVATPECNEAWAALKARGDVNVIVEFKPSDHVDVGKLNKAAAKQGMAGSEILGIITSDNRCFAIGATKQQSHGDTTVKIASISEVK